MLQQGDYKYEKDIETAKAKANELTLKIQKFLAKSTNKYIIFKKNKIPKQRGKMLYLQQNKLWS